jgi:hypothetical protein
MLNDTSGRGLSGSRFVVGVLRLGVVILCLAVLLIGQTPNRSNASAPHGLLQSTDEDSVAPDSTDETVDETAEATPTRRPTRRPTWTNTPDVAEMTAVLRLSTAYAKKFNQRYYPTATLIAEDAELLVDSQEGSLRDDAKGFIASYSANVNVKNAIISVRFHNAEKKLGYFGIMFRDQYSDKQYRLYIDYLGSWNYGYGTATYSGGSLQGRLDRTVGGFNDLLLIVQDETALFFMNGDYITKLNVKRVMESGDVSLIAGMYSNQKTSGQVTDFDHFTIWELPE